MDLIQVPGIQPSFAADDAYVALDYAKKVATAHNKSKLALASCLYIIKEKDYWKSVAESFDEYTYKEFGYSPSTVSALIQIYTTLVLNLKIDPEVLKEIPWAKLQMIVPHINESNKDELINVARVSTQSELNKHLKDMQGLHVTESKTATGKKFTFTTNDDQAEVVEAALDKAREAFGDRDDLPPGMVYEAIFADYLLSSESEVYNKSHLKHSIGTLERIHNVKITYESNSGLDSEEE